MTHLHPNSSMYSMRFELGSSLEPRSIVPRSATMLNFDVLFVLHARQLIDVVEATATNNLERFTALEPSAMQRVEGSCKALEAAGIEPKPRWLRSNISIQPKKGKQYYICVFDEVDERSIFDTPPRSEVEYG